MKLKTKNKKVAFFTLAAIAALAVVVGALYLKNKSSQDSGQPTPTSQINYNPPVKEQQDAGNQAKEGAITPSPSTTDNNTQSKTVGVIITQSEQKSDGSLQIGAIVQTSNSGGSCSLRLVQAAKGTVVTKESPTISQNRYLACADFNIPSSDLSAGDWQLTVEYIASNEHGSATQGIRIK